MYGFCTLFIDVQMICINSTILEQFGYMVLQSM
jgi:hypothetical protein